MGFNIHSYGTDWIPQFGADIKRKREEKLANQQAGIEKSIEMQTGWGEGLTTGQEEYVTGKYGGELAGTYNKKAKMKAEQLVIEKQNQVFKNSNSLLTASKNLLNNSDPRVQQAGRSMMLKAGEGFKKAGLDVDFSMLTSKDNPVEIINNQLIAKASALANKSNPNAKDVTQMRQIRMQLGEGQAKGNITGYVDGLIGDMGKKIASKEKDTKQPSLAERKYTKQQGLNKLNSQLYSQGLAEHTEDGFAFKKTYTPEEYKKIESIAKQMGYEPVSREGRKPEFFTSEKNEPRQYTIAGFQKIGSQAPTAQAGVVAPKQVQKTTPSQEVPMSSERAMAQEAINSAGDDKAKIKAIKDAYKKRTGEVF